MRASSPCCWMSGTGAKDSRLNVLVLLDAVSGREVSPQGKTASLQETDVCGRYILRG